MRKLFVCLGWLASMTIGFAQPVIEKDYNLLRTEDYLFKQQVEFVNPGTNGENQFWDFSNLKVIDDKYKVSHMEYPDSLLIARELRSLYKYALKGDTLISTGIENITTLLEYKYPQLQLIFPVRYNDESVKYFYGEGDYCKQIKLTLDGFCSYHADAWGKIALPEGDTLSNVLRIKYTVRQVEKQEVYDPYFITDSILPAIKTEEAVTSDSLWTETETYRWYAEGYRYPVFESIQYYIHYKGNKELKAETSFYYSPYEQYYGLEDDPDNREQRERSMLERELLAKKKSSPIHQENMLVSEYPEFSYSLHLDRQEGVLTLEYRVETATEIAVILMDMQGKIVLQLPKVWKEEGEYVEEIPVNNYIKEEYLVRIIADGKSYMEKIIN